MCFMQANQFIQAYVWKLGNLTYSVYIFISITIKLLFSLIIAFQLNILTCIPRTLAAICCRVEILYFATIESVGRYNCINLTNRLLPSLLSPYLCLFHTDIYCLWWSCSYFIYVYNCKKIHTEVNFPRNLPSRDPTFSMSVIFAVNERKAR